MTVVVIAPSYGSAESRRHWRTTLDNPVDYRAAALRQHLTPDQAAQLDLVHPDGRARFWGARPRHDAQMSAVGRGDLVLFTGQNQVRAVGEVGVIFRNQPFADVLWPPDTNGQSWHTVYSLTGFQFLGLGYPALCRMIGYKESLTFPGQILLRGDKAQRVLDGLLIDTAARREAEPPAGELATVEAGLTKLLAAEAVHTAQTTYTQEQALRVANRTEALLMLAYREFLDREDLRRYQCPAGVTDLYLVTEHGPEVVEAKRDGSFVRVREAVAQLLAYAPHCPEPGPLVLTGLFPEPVGRSGLDLLHRYGIDCVVPEGDRFRRFPAPDERRTLMQGIWAA